jgi:hypothetical protein
MYTHMASALSTQWGQPIARGAQVGTVGDRGAPGTPHLHFTAYIADGPWGRGTRKSLPLRFAEGYDLPDIGGCSQHGGVELVSANRVATPGLRVYAPQVGTGARAHPDVAAPAPAQPSPQAATHTNARWSRCAAAMRPNCPR